MLTAIFLLINAAIVVFCVYKFVQNYRAAEGSTWERLVSAAKGSASVLWGYVVTASGYLISWSEQATAFFNFPEVQKFITDNVTPTRLGIVMIVIGAISIVARLRTLGS